MTIFVPQFNICSQKLGGMTALFTPNWLRAWQKSPGFPLRKFYTEQISVLVCMQLGNRVDTQTTKRFKGYAANIRY